MKVLISDCLPEGLCRDGAGIPVFDEEHLAELVRFAGKGGKRMRAIVAVDEHWGIGRAGQLLCPISADLRRFKALTLGHPVILGRKTLSTFPGGRPLPGRRNLILSRDPAFQAAGAEVFSGREALLAAAPDDSVIIGGESIYRLLLDFCDTVWVTRIFKTFEADAWFPDLDADPAWRPAETEPPLEEGGVRFQYVTYTRRGED